MTKSGTTVVLAFLGVIASVALGAMAPVETFTFRVGDAGHLGAAVAVDAAGNSYILGSFSPLGGGPFPVTENAFQKPRASLFVAKVDARGDRLVWASHLGGSRNRNFYWRGALDSPTAIATDPQGNVFVTGSTAALDFPVENAAVAMPQPTGSEGFLTKISADGSKILYSTYLGGGYASALSVDAAGNAYVAIAAENRRLPFERLDLSAPGVNGATVVTKFNPAGQPVIATRFGTAPVIITAIGVDPFGAIVVAGSTIASGFPLVNPITAKCSAPALCPFVTRLNPSGSEITYSTLLGGATGPTAITSMALDPAGSAYIAGTTSASDYPVQGAYQGALRGPEDYVLTKISPAGRLEASTFLGGDTAEGFTDGPEVVVDLRGRPTLLAATVSLTGVGAMQHPDVPLWRSDDDGRSWFASANGLKTSAWAFAVSERDRTWYVGAVDGVYRSTDGGTSWQRSMAGVPADATETYALAIDPAHSGTVYAGTRGGTYKSTDRGATWGRVDADAVYGGPYHPASHAALIVDGNGTVFLGTEGVRRSVDGGRTWVASSDGLEPGPTGRYGSVGPIVFDPNVAGTVYALQGSRPFRSRDGGATWARLDPAFPPESPYGIRDFYGLSVPPGRPGRVFASGWTEVLRSDNDGANWRTLIDRQLLRARFLMSPLRPETMYAYDGWAGAPLLVSYDAGDTWAGATVPRPDQRVFALDPLQPGALFAPAPVRSLPILVTFDAAVQRVVLASFLDLPRSNAAAMDPSGALYLLRQADGRTVLMKMQLP